MNGESEQDGDEPGNTPHTAASPMPSERAWRDPEAEGEPVAQVTVAVFPDVIQAELAKGTLDAAGIGARLADDNTAAVAPHLAIAIGGVRLMVAEPDVEEAQAVLENPAELESAHDEPAFRVKATLSGPVGLGVGTVAFIVAGVAWSATGIGWPLGVAAVLTYGGFALGDRFRRDYCSRASCGARLADIDAVCPSCGHQLMGTLEKLSDRLEAAEALERVPHGESAQR